MAGMIRYASPSDFDKAREKWKTRYPNCTCYFDDYGLHLEYKVDCPDHGELRRGASRDDTCWCGLAFGHDGACASASDTQVGGDHYSRWKIQPIDFITANNVPFIEGNVIKYVMRHSFKNGAQDIDKAIHYLQMLKERMYPDA